MFDQKKHARSAFNSDWGDFKEKIKKTRSDLFRPASSARYPVDVIDLRMNGARPLTKHEGYIRASQWIVDTSEILIAVLDDSRKSNAQAEWTDGGTGQTVAHWELKNKGEYLRIDPALAPVR